MPNEKLTFEEEVIERFKSERIYARDLLLEILHQHKLHLLKEIEGRLPVNSGSEYGGSELNWSKGFDDGWNGFKEQVQEVLKTI